MGNAKQIEIAVAIDIAHALNESGRVVVHEWRIPDRRVHFWSLVPV